MEQLCRGMNTFREQRKVRQVERFVLHPGIKSRNAEHLLERVAHH
jgi:hypothetical protein